MSQHNDKYKDCPLTPPLKREKVRENEFEKLHNVLDNKIAKRKARLELADCNKDTKRIAASIAASADDVGATPEAGTTAGVEIDR